MPQRLELSVVDLVYPDVDGRWFSLCAGVLVEQDRILTALHCVDDATDGHYASYRAWLKTGGDYGSSTQRWTRLRYNQKHDLALLAILPNPEMVAARVGELPVSGAPVWLIGSPSGYAFTVSSGVVGRPIRWFCDDLECVEYLQASVPGWFGNSGGPLFDAEGEVVGIANWGGDNMFGGIVPHLLFLAPPTVIADFLARP